MKKCLTIISGLFLLCSCNYLQPKEKPNALARVGENYLFEEDLNALGISDLSSEDSTKIVDGYIDNWIKKQALLQNASRNLTSQQLLEVDQKVLDYKESLLSFLYETRIVDQRVDTIVTEQEIELFYNENQEELEIASPILKFYLIKNDKPFQNINEINNWLTSFEKTGNDSELKEYCSFQAITCLFDIENWVELKNLYETLGAQEGIDIDVSLKTNQLIKYEKGTYFYIYKIIDFKKEGIYPLSFVRSKIEAQIIRKREQAFLEELRSNIFETAKINNEIEIYDK